MSIKKINIWFIVNPISGNREGVKACAHISQVLDLERFLYEVKYTEYAGHASIMAREAVEQGVDVVAAVGGDGTVNEIARVLAHTSTALAIVPVGSGNGLARHLRIPMDTKKALEIINHCVIKSLDFGVMNDHPFFCTCGIGFDAFVSHQFAQSGKRGLLSYLENTLHEGLKYKPQTYRIETPDRTIEMDAFLITCANASQYGNNAFIAPEASMSDGLLDVVVMKPFSVFEAPQVALQLFTRTLSDSSHIVTFKAKEVKITRQDVGVAHYDGDPIEIGEEIDIRIVPAGIRMVVHPEGKITDTPLQAFLDFFVETGQYIDDNIKQGRRHIKAIDQKILQRLKGK